MRRKIVLCVSIMVSFAGAGCAALMFIPRPHLLTWEKLARIEKGMTKEQVRVILGPETASFAEDDNLLARLEWSDGDSTIRVFFLDDDTVFQKAGSIAGSQTLLGAFLDRLEFCFGL